jgi:putative toxin-antitoxin system antitoxin component (TIGR02293 family)
VLVAYIVVSDQEIDCFVMPGRRSERTNNIRKLTVGASYQAARLSRIKGLADKTFGNRAEAKRWLRRPLMALGGEAPLVIAQSEAGARVVETMLGKIGWAAAA